MFAKELKTRLQNNQILVNGEPEKADYDMGNITIVYDQGFFLEELYDMPNYEKWVDQIMFFGIVNLIGGESNIKNELTDFLKKYKMVQLSKKDEAIFVETSDSPSDTIDFRLEKGKRISKIEAPVEVDQSGEIAKIKGLKMKIDKQLSNPGFVKNAPAFKLEAAKKRQEVLAQQLRDLGVNESVVTRFKDFI